MAETANRESGQTDTADRENSRLETSIRESGHTEKANREIGLTNMEQLYASCRSDLLALAYRMLGSVSDAEDVVQELFASVQVDRLSRLSNPKAYLAKAVMHRSLNVLKSAARRKVSYVGLWLPEPWVQSDADTAREVERREDMSYAFVVLLEKLTPLERAVLVLREAYECEYAEIAGMLDRTEAACRKLLSRARRKLEGRSLPIAPVRPRDEQNLVQKWVSAMSRGQIDDILGLIAEDAVLVTDGGGKVRAAINPIFGRNRVAALLKKIADSRFRHACLYTAMINGSFGIVATLDGQVMAVVCFDWNAKGTAQNLYIVLNPDKLVRVTAEGAGLRADK